MAEFRQVLGERAIDRFMREWGESAEHRIASARGLLGGVSADDLAALEREIGSENVLRGAAELARELYGPSVAEALSPDVAVSALRARAVRSRLESNPEWRERYLSGDEQARSELHALQELAHPRREGASTMLEPLDHGIMTSMPPRGGEDGD